MQKCLVLQDVTGCCTHVIPKDIVLAGRKSTIPAGQCIILQLSGTLKEYCIPYYQLGLGITYTNEQAERQAADHQRRMDALERDWSYIVEEMGWFGEGLP